MTLRMSGKAREGSTATRFGIANAIAFVLVALSLLGICYYVFDLIYPNRFVGDMYGLEVVYRVALLSLPLAAIVVGSIIIAVARRRQIAPLRTLGFGLLLAGSACVLALCLSVVHARRLNEIRKGYPAKSVTELIQIARERKDVAAIDALIIKRDFKAVSALGEILGDQTEDVPLRHVAAQALGQLGGEEAKAALERARPHASDEYLGQSIDSALESIARAESVSRPPVDRR